MNNLLRIAHKASKSSRHTWAFHVSIVLRAGNILSIATNHDYTHAEVQALANLWPDQRQGTRLVSLRFTKGGKLASSYPCADCLDFMRKQGVKRVLFARSDGKLYSEKI